MDPLVFMTEEYKRRYRGSIDKININGRDGKVKVKYRSSCDCIKID